MLASAASVSFTSSMVESVSTSFSILVPPAVGLTTMRMGAMLLTPHRLTSQAQLEEQSRFDEQMMRVDEVSVARREVLGGCKQVENNT